MSLTNRRTKGVQLSLALLLGSTSSAALAQTAFVPLPQPRTPTDDVGVNLANGGLELSDVDVSIGTSEAGLSHVRKWVNRGWRHDFMASAEFFGGKLFVTVGSKTRTFLLRSDGTFAPLEGDGATLRDENGKYIYSLPDGTVVTFDQAITSSKPSYYSNNTVKGIATKIVKPDGEIIDLTYKTDWYEREDNTYDTPFIVRFYVVRLQSVQSSLGFQLKYGYASNQATDADNWYLINKVTAINNSVEHCDPQSDTCSLSQNWPSVTYLKNGNQETVTDAAGRVTRYTTSDGYLTGIKAPRSPSADTTTYSYHPTIRSAVTNVSNGQHSWGYSWTETSSTRTTTITDPLGHQRVVSVDWAQGVVKSQRDAVGRTETFEHDPFGRLTATVSSTGVRTEYTLDDRGNVERTRIIPVAKANQSTPAEINTFADYPDTCANPRSCNKPITTTDALGRVTDYTYDPIHGEITSITLPEPQPGKVRPQTRFAYLDLTPYFVRSPGGGVTAGPATAVKLRTVSTCATAASCANSADEIRTTMTYGQAGQPNNLFLTQVASGSGVDPLMTVTSYGYDIVGNQNMVDGALAGAIDVTRFQYNAARDLDQVTGPDPDGSGGALRPRAARYVRNADGQVEQAQIGTANADGTGFAELQRVTVGYDLLGRKTAERLSMGGTVYSSQVMIYDPANRLTCVIQRMNKAQLVQAPPGSCAPGTTGADGFDRATELFYTVADELRVVRSGVGATDASGSPLMQDTQTTTYGVNGQVESVADARGNTSVYTYDGFERPWQTNYPNGSFERQTYDAGGRVTQTRLRDGQVIGLVPDALGRTIAKNRPGTAPNEANVAYSYDNLGRLTGANDSRGQALNFVYDALGRLKSEASNTVTGELSYDYDAAGRRTRMSWSDGLFVLYDWHATGDLWRVREFGATSGVGLLATYGYDDLGRRTSLARGNGTSTSWGYAGTPWLASLVHDLAGSTYDVTRSFTRSAAGEIRTLVNSNDAYAYRGQVTVNRAYPSANVLNQYGSAGPASFQYDGRGNLTQSSGPTGTTNYAYTADNMLASSSGGGFAYDPLDRLYLQGASSTVLRYAGDQLTTEQAASGGAILRRYVPGAGVDEPLVWYEGAGAGDRRWLHADERGSVVAVSNGSGNVLAINRYDEYGIPDASGDGRPNTANLGRFQYTGQTWLAEVGMYHYKARVYSPTLGRFMQTDPIGYGDGMNLYAYVGNNPVNATDPSGMASEFKPLRFEHITGPGYLDPPPGPDIVVKGWPIRSLPANTSLGLSIPNVSTSEFASGAPQNENSLKPATRKYLCGKLGANNGNVPKTYRDVLSDRRSRTNGRSNWGVPAFRQAENFLYATGQWRNPSTDGSTYVGVYFHQYAKYVFSGTSEFSQDALDAGLAGVDHKNASPAKLKEFLGCR